MAALGHKRPYRTSLAQCLLSGVKRTLNHIESGKIERPLSAKSGHGAPYIPEILPAYYYGAVAFARRTFHMNSRHIANVNRFNIATAPDIQARGLIKLWPAVSGFTNVDQK